MSEYASMLQEYISDFPEVNRLLSNTTQFKKGKYELAIKVAADWIEKQPPTIRLTIQECPLQLVLRRGIVVLLENAAIVDTRNSVPRQDGGVMISDTKEREYLDITNTLDAKTYNEVRLFKDELNKFRSLGVMNA